jgi:ornithine cyclodeaminase/alanine dehydrogenase-like protein (mu-crystallin family)
MHVWLNPADIEARLDLDGLRGAMTQALTELYTGRALAPARVAVHAPLGLLAAMPGRAGGLLGAKLVSVFPENSAHGLPGHQALLALFDAATGTPVAVLDATRLTAERTAAVSAAATAALARRDARVLAVLGTGVQAEAHLRALRRVRPFQQVLLAGRNPDRVRSLAATANATAAAGIEAAVRAADVVCACTHAATPLFPRAWLKPGAHVNSVGIGGCELDRGTITAGLLTVEAATAFAPFPAGAYELQGLPPESGVAIGAVFSGDHPGRGSEDQITVFKCVGHAVEDVAAGAWLLPRPAC